MKFSFTVLILVCSLAATAQGTMYSFRGAIDSAYYYHGQLLRQVDGTATGQYKYDNQKDWIEMAGTMNGNSCILYEYITVNKTRTANSVFTGTMTGDVVTGTWHKLDGKNKEYPFYLTPAENMTDATTQCTNATLFTTDPSKAFPARKHQIYLMTPDRTTSAGAVIWFDQAYSNHFTIGFDFMTYHDTGTRYEATSSQTADGISLILFKDKQTYVTSKVPVGSDKGFIKDGTGFCVYYNIYDIRGVEVINGWGIFKGSAPTDNVYTVGNWVHTSVSVDDDIVTCYLGGEQILRATVPQTNKPGTGFGIGAATGAITAMHQVKNVTITRRSK